MRPWDDHQSPGERDLCARPAAAPVLPVERPTYHACSGLWESKLASSICGVCSFFQEARWSRSLSRRAEALRPGDPRVDSVKMNWDSRTERGEGQPADGHERLDVRGRVSRTSLLKDVGVGSSVVSAEMDARSGRNVAPHA